MQNLNNRNKNIRIGPIGEAILGILAAGALVSFFAFFPGVTSLIAPFIKRKKYSSRQAITRNLESLIKSGLVEKTKDEKGNISLRLTKKGIWEAMLRHQSMPTATKEKKQRWDNIWRMVIFDIPNEKNKTRSDLRRAMHMYGFKSIQKSVWVYPFECDNFVTLLKFHLGVTNDVLYIKASYIENDRHLQKEFSL